MVNSQSSLSSSSSSYSSPSLSLSILLTNSCILLTDSCGELLGVAISYGVTVIQYIINPGADPGLCEGGVRIRDGSRREELTLVLYL